MLKVYKYELPTADTFTLQLPKGAVPLSVQLQQGVPYLWALVDPTADLIPRQFRMAGTGHPIEEPAHHLHHVDTVQLYGGSLVFHLFEINA